MKQEIIDLYDEYTHAPLPRRVFLDRLANLAGGAAAAYALLPLLENSPARAAMVAPDDARLKTGMETFRGATGPVQAYAARPKGTAKLPWVVVIHENRGLNPHIQDIARRLAAEGFGAFAVDALSPLGGTPDDSDRAREMMGSLDRAQTTANYVSAVAHVKRREDGTGKAGAIGFCWGGGMANELAARSAELDAAVVYYGASPREQDVAKISAPLLLHYAGLDGRINASVPAYEAALKAAGKPYELHMYEGVNHAFNNDTGAARYDARAAALAWGRTIGFLKKTLAG